MNYYRTMKNIARVITTRNIITEAGVTEFSTKEFEALCKHQGACTLDFLRTYRLVKQTRVEEFDKAYPAGRAPTEVVILDRNGEKLMPYYEWCRLTKSVKAAMEKVNGQPFEIREIATATFKAKRYFYTLDLENIDKYINKYEPRAKASLEKLLAKAQEKVNYYTAILALR